MARRREPHTILARARMALTITSRRQELSVWFGLSARDGRISSPPASCCTDASKLAEVPAATTACSDVTAPAALIRLLLISARASADGDGLSFLDHGRRRHGRVFLTAGVDTGAAPTRRVGWLRPRRRA
eukprot:COSAG01_NODE_5824_length_4010_cov_4.300690_2_plen_129_part_00